MKILIKEDSHNNLWCIHAFTPFRLLSTAWKMSKFLCTFCTFIIISVQKGKKQHNSKEKEDYRGERVPQSKVSHPSISAPFFFCFGLLTPDSSGRVACFRTAAEFGQKEEDGAERQRVTTQTWRRGSNLKKLAGTFHFQTELNGWLSDFGNFATNSGEGKSELIWVQIKVQERAGWRSADVFKGACLLLHEFGFISVKSQSFLLGASQKMHKDDSNNLE